MISDYIENALFNFTGSVEAVRETTVYKLYKKQEEPNQEEKPKQEKAKEDNNLSTKHEFKINESSFNSK